MKIRSQVQQLIELSQEPPLPVIPAEDAITVSIATQKLASAYERFRNTLEPDEEDLLRRKAIGRILARRILEDRPALASATAFLQELLRARYIARASRSHAQFIAQKFEAIRYITQHTDTAFHEWFLSVMAVLIDREFYPRRKEETLVHLMYHDTYPRLRWADNMVEPADRPAQVFIGCHRALFAADDDEIAYHYFLHHLPLWRQDSVSEQTLEATIGYLPDIYEEINTLLTHPGRQRLLTVLRPLSVPYRTLWVICQNPPLLKILAEEQNVPRAARKAIRKRSKQISRRMHTRAWHSILFLFCTKIVLALIIELPYEYFFLRQIHWLALAANTAFHPLLLFVLAISTRLPRANNTEKIIEQLEKIIQGEELSDVVMQAPRQYGPLTWAFFAVLYTLLFMGIFWGLFSLLLRLNFSLPAMILFVTFLGLVTFLAARIRRSTEELRIIPKKEGIFGITISFIALPILEFGSWLSRSIRQLNVILFLMDRVLEAPFKLLIDIAEEWFSFVRERREEIV